MSLDFSLTPDQALDRPSREQAPDALSPVARLSQQSGIPTGALSALDSGERDAMARLETSVARTLHDAGQPGSGVPAEVTQAAVAARNQVRDDLVARHMPGSLDGLQLADARVTIERSAPGSSRAAPAAPADARLQIRNQTITIDSDVYIYGSGATQTIADTFERQIQNEWGKNPATRQPWTYTDPQSGQTYDVQFNVDVKVYDPDNPSSTPGLFSGRYSPWNRDNFIEVTSQNGRSYVSGGDEGQWRAHGRGGRTLAADNPAAHEFGHILGLPDRYVEGGGPQRGWSGNIMAMPAGQGVVQQRDIDTLVRSHVAQYRQDGSPRTFNSTINP